MPRRRPKTQGGRKLGMVLSGGGARGAFQVGVYQRLLEDRRFANGPAVLSGTSAGAINSALIAAGKTPKEMMDFWNSVADNAPAVASPRFFDSAARTLLRLGISETVGLLLPGRRWGQLLQRARNHFPPRRGSLLALLVEYLLTARFEVVSHLLEGIREPFLADTAQLRERLVDFLGGEHVQTRDGIDVAINTVDAHTGRVVQIDEAAANAAA